MSKTSNKPKIEPYKWHVVESSPFQLLSQEDQDRLVNQFIGLLNSMNDGIIYIKNVFDYYEYENAKYPVTITKFHFGTKR